MAYDLKKGMDVLKNTIVTKEPHKDYARVTEIAEQYTKFATGVGIETLLERFTPRENEDAFNQRIKLSQLITPAIVNSIAAPMYKVARTNAEESIKWSTGEEKEKKKSELNFVLSKFYGEQSVESYLNQRLVELDCTDPNTFIAVEFQGEYDPKKPDQKVTPYPFEINSKEAFNYKYVNNELQFLIVKLDKYDIDEKEQPVVLNKFTQYLENDNIVATQVLAYKLAKEVMENPKAEVFYTNEKEKEKGEIYLIEVFNHNNKKIQAKRIGTKKDLSTRGRTCVPMMHPAYSFLMKSVKTVSEFDLTNCLHVFQKLVQYDETCPGNRQKNIVCNGGKTPEGKDCPECEGSGWKNHKSSADIIRVKLPKDPKDMANLNSYMAYFAPAMDLLEFQKKFGFYELTQLAIKSVYTSDLFSSDQVVATATEKSIDLESVYDALKPFADNYSGLKMHIIYCVAQFRNLGEGFSISHQFPKNFKMESLSMLLDYLAKANTSGSPAYVKDEINKDIAKKLYADKPHELLELETKAKYYPFNGKSESEINNILLNDLTTQYNKVLYANFNNVFSQLEEEHQLNGLNFYMIEPKKQSELVKAKVQELVDAINKEQGIERQAAFNQNIPGA